MLDPTGLTTLEIKKRRKQILQEFHAEINGYANDLSTILSGRNLKKEELKEIQKEIESLDEMRKLFYAEVKILKESRTRKKPLKKSGFLGFNFSRRSA